MNDYIIFMDASADVDPSVIAEADIKCVPMEYSLGEEMLTCVGLETQERLKAFYDSQRNGELTKTTQIAPYNYITTFSEYMNEGRSILYFSLSSGLSSTFESVCSIKDELEEKYPDARLYPVDTLGATGGIGMLIERAASNRSAGMSIEENYNDIEAFKLNVNYLFMVPDLMYLKRGGRVSAASAVLGTALNIVPLIKIDENGKLVVFEKKRGAKLAVKELVRIAAESWEPQYGNTGYIINADAPETVQMLQDKLKEALPEVNFKVVGLSPIIGAHTGPGMAAVVVAGHRAV